MFYYFVETSKRLPSTSSASSTSSNSTTTTTTTTNKCLKSKLIPSKNNEIQTINKEKMKNQKTINGSNRKRSNYNDSNNNSTKKLKQSTYNRQFLSHPIIHRHKKQSQTDNISTSINKNEYNHNYNHHHHHFVINNDHCDLCGELYGEMISCDTCPATFHLLCANPPLSREDVPKGSYYCENCRTKKAEEEEGLINKNQRQTEKTFSFNSKNKLHMNGFKNDLQKDSKLGQIKLPTGNNISFFL